MSAGMFKEDIVQLLKNAGNTLCILCEIEEE